MPARARPKRSPRRTSAARRRWWLLAVAFGIVAVPVAAVIGWVVFAGSGESDSGPPRAVIVDQLSLTLPNQEFADEATVTLEQAGYQVDYISGDQVNVAFYRELPSLDYDVIVLRVHSDRLQGEWQGEQLDETVLFSNEPFNEEKYLDDRAKARLTLAHYYEGSEELFGISPTFIEDKADGNFDGALVIAMGCEGLGSTRTAEAFINKGASGFIGWDQLVTGNHTDSATTRLLQFLFVDRLSTHDAVDRTMAEVGPDPAYDSKLIAYPGTSS